MLDFDLDKVINSLYLNIYGGLEFYLPKIVGAVIILIIGTIISIGLYKFVIFLFKKFKIVELIDKLDINISDEEDKKDDSEVKKSILSKKISQKIKIDQIIAKSVSYYVFLVFFRLSIVVIGIEEVEKFLGDIIAYLPSLFIGFIIGFFGMRFANFIYDIIYHGLNLTKQKTSRIIASGARVIVLFFTLMAVLSKVGIATEITNTILTGFVAMLTIAGGIAFGLGGKDIAHDILESFKK